jgi:hypothetical protein
MFTVQKKKTSRQTMRKIEREKKRTTIMMQLVRIWRLKEIKERYVKII